MSPAARCVGLRTIELRPVGVVAIDPEAFGRTEVDHDVVAPVAVEVGRQQRDGMQAISGLQVLLLAKT